MFLATFVCSWVYNCYLSSIDKEEVQRGMLMSKVLDRKTGPEEVYVRKENHSGGISPFGPPTTRQRRDIERVTSQQHEDMEDMEGTSTQTTKCREGV
ncbi:hypothetical protein FRB91_004822 [Serendipita sp. 411]|nr:hypothetical protein FRB91_004822 [Serendipita sp. 411]